MRPPFRTTLVTLLAAATVSTVRAQTGSAATALAATAPAGAATAPATRTSPSTSPSTPLIDGLGDADPRVRVRTIQSLVDLGMKALPSLRAASHDPRPAVAEAAAATANALLLSGKWWVLTDPPAYRLVLQGYGRQPPAGRAAAVQTIITRQLPDFRRVALRVLTADPSDEVAWLALQPLQPDGPGQDAPVDDDWMTALAALDPATRPPSATLLLARGKLQRGRADAALPLINAVLDHERDRPMASGEQLGWAVDKAVDADVRARRYAAAAGRLREQFARADDRSTSQPELIDRLMDLHLRYGPLPGLSVDLRAAGPDFDGRAAITMAVVARRSGLPAAAATLMDAALRDRPGEDDSLRAARLLEAGEYLWKARLTAAAANALERVTRIEAEPARVRVVLAYAWLSQIHAEVKRYQQAGDDLQRALDRQQMPLQVLRNGRDEPWATEDEQAKVYWYYLLDAQQRGDGDAARKEAGRIVASGSTDGSLFLDALPALQKAVAADALDAYFERVFTKGKSRLDQATEETKPVELNDLAWLCARADRRLPEALAWAGQAVKLRPLEGAYLDTLAEAKFRTGSVQEAVDLESRAILNHPEDEPFMRDQLARFRAAATTRPSK